MTFSFCGIHSWLTFPISALTPPTLQTPPCPPPLWGYPQFWRWLHQEEGFERGITTCLTKVCLPQCTPNWTVKIVTSKQPTERSWHIFIKFFAIQDQKHAGDIVIINPCDDPTKPLRRVLHSRHALGLMRHHHPRWQTCLVQPPVLLIISFRVFDQGRVLEGLTDMGMQATPLARSHCFVCPC